MNVYINQNLTDTVKNNTIDGFKVSAFLRGKTAGLSLPDIDGDQEDNEGFNAWAVNVTLETFQDGKKIVNWVGPLALLALDQTFEKGRDKWVFGEEIVKVGTGVFQEKLHFFKLQLGHMNLNGADEVRVTVNVTRHAFGTEVDENQSYIDITPVSSIGKQMVVPVYESKVVAPNKLRETFNLGDNITRIVFLNTEKTAPSDNYRQLIQTCTLGSDRLDKTLTANDLLQEQFDYMANNYGTQGDSQVLINQIDKDSLIIHNGEEIDAVQVDLQLKHTAIAESKNYLVIRSFVTSQEMIHRGLRTNAKHEAENISKQSVTL